MLDFTFLTYEQCFVESKKLDVLKSYGTKAKPTDFAILENRNNSDPVYYLSTCNEKEYGVVSDYGSFFTRNFVDKDFV